MFVAAIGQSLIFPTHMVAVNTYFDKHRSTASGISYIGGTLVSFVMPDVYEALVKRWAEYAKANSRFNKQCHNKVLALVKNDSNIIL